MKATIRLYSEHPLAEVPLAARMAAAKSGVSLSVALRSINMITRRSAYMIDPNIAKVQHIRRPGPDLIAACISLLLALGVEVTICALPHTEPMLVKTNITPDTWAKLLVEETALSAAKEIRDGFNK